MTTHTRAVDPIPRIEGHLGVKLTLNPAETHVVQADAHGNMFRGFENFLIGRDPNDAITFTQRICGVCPVPHGTTATFAVEAAYGYSNGHVTFKNNGLNDPHGVPLKALHVRNLILGAEFLMSSITHFYHLAAPSYVQGPAMPPWTPYFHDNYYNELLQSNGAALPGDTAASALWSAVITQYVKALRMRRLTFEAGALFAGRMPMTSAFVAGGVTTQDRGNAFRDKCKKFYNLLHEVGLFIVREYVPLALSLGALYPQYDNKFNNNLGAAANDTGTLEGGEPYGIGAGLGNFLCWGGFPQANDDLAIKGGFKLAAGPVQELVTGKSNVGTMIAAVNANLTEDTARSWYDAHTNWGYATGQSSAKPGDVTRTQPNRLKTVDKYSWMKAPRWMVENTHHAMEVGPLARMVVQGWYPVDGRRLSATFNVAGYFGYAHYLGNLTVIDQGLRDALAAVDLPEPATNLLDAVVDWITNLKGGLSVMDRIRARALESLVLVQLILGAFNPSALRFGADPGAGYPTSGWIGAAADLGNAELERGYISKQPPVGLTKGYGALEAPRGSLSHHVSQAGGRITAYQCVVPTTWNASPKDRLGAGGAMEQAMIGSPYANHGDAATRTPGVEAMRIAQSFDPCIACAVH